MKRRVILLGTAALSAGLPGWLRAQAQAVGPLKQVSLCIGNNDYRDAARLVNAVSDAALMHKTFARLGAQGELRQNQDSAGIKRAVIEFVRKMKGGNVDIAWFFYSGHGAALDGKSLLLGTDVSLQSPVALKASGFDLDLIKGWLAEIRPRVSVVIVDACRNNPFQTRDVAKRDQGMVPKPWDGTLVAYSTAEYTRALDGAPRPNGPYVTALSAALTDATPRGLEDAFRAAGRVVYENTDKQQIPGCYSELRSQVWLDAGKISLRELPVGEQQATAPGKMGRASRNAAPRIYRADLQLDDQYAGTSPGDWAREMFELENGAPRMDRYEAAQALTRARSASASDRELCLAGLLSETGLRQQGIEKNRGQAARFYERAAVRGYVPAQTLLGELAYARQDYVQSYKWLSVAARSGYGRPLMDLAQLSGQGLGTAQDPQKAVQLMMESLKSIPGLTPPGK